MKSSHYSILLLILLIGSIYIRIQVIQQHRVPSGDEGPWLRMASRVGSSEFLQSNVIEHDLYFQKKIPHPEDNRSPLYPIIIKMVHPFVGDHFLAGQMVNLITWVIFFFVSAMTVKNKFGYAAALVTSIYLTLSPHFILYSAHVYPDLMITLGFLSVFSYGKWFAQARFNSFVAGIISGALLLMKSTSIFLLPVMGYYFYKNRKEKFGFTNPVIFSMTVIIVMIPWVIRNVQEFGSPMYQFSEYNLYIDNFNNLLKIGIARPSLNSVISEYGAFFVFVMRPVHGVISMISKFGQFDEYLSVVMLPLSFVGLSVTCLKKSKGCIPLLIFSIPYFLFMGYVAYAVWVHRFTMIFYFFVYACAGVGVSYVVKYVKIKTKKHILAIIIPSVVALIPLISVVYPIEYYNSKRGSDAVYDQNARKLIEKMNASVPADAVVFSSFLSDYCFLHNFAVVDKLGYDTVADLENFLQSYKVSYFLLDKKTDAALLTDLSGTELYANNIEVEQIGDMILYRIN